MNGSGRLAIGLPDLQGVATASTTGARQPSPRKIPWRQRFRSPFRFTAKMPGPEMTKAVTKNPPWSPLRPPRNLPRRTHAK